MRIHSVAAALLVMVMVQTTALAQTPPAPDSNCPLNRKVEKRQLASGRITTMEVKVPASEGHLDCKGGGGCTNDVEVQAFKRAEGGADACCTLIHYGEMRVIRRDKDVPLKWKLVEKDRNTYVFNADGIHFITPPTPTPGDFESPTYNGNRKIATMISINGRLQTFNYGVSVSMDLGGGKYLACDPNDPVIVNQGN